MTYKYFKMGSVMSVNKFWLSVVSKIIIRLT